MNSEFIPTQITENHRLGQSLIKLHENMLLNRDVFGVITGSVGNGKSRGLFLNIMDFWYKQFHNKIPPKHCFGVSFEDYLKALKKATPFDFAGLDEGGDIFDKGNSSSRVLVDLYQTYGIIREKKIFTCIVIPSIFDLYTKFAINRVKFWINVVKRVDKKCKKCGKKYVETKCPKCGHDKYTGGFVVFDFYSKKRLKQILEYNQYRQNKTLKCGISPMFQGSTREYKGELVSHYNKLKDQKATRKIDELYAKYTEKSEDKKSTKKEMPQGVKYVLNYAEKHGVTACAKEFEIDRKTVYNYRKRWKEDVEVKSA